MTSKFKWTYHNSRDSCKWSTLWGGTEGSGENWTLVQSWDRAEVIKALEHLRICPTHHEVHLLLVLINTTYKEQQSYLYFSKHIMRWRHQLARGQMNDCASHAAVSIKKRKPSRANRQAPPHEKWGRERGMDSFWFISIESKRWFQSWVHLLAS